MSGYPISMEAEGENRNMPIITALRFHTVRAVEKIWMKHIMNLVKNNNPHEWDQNRFIQRYRLEKYLQKRREEMENMSENERAIMETLTDDPLAARKACSTVWHIYSLLIDNVDHIRLNWKKFDHERVKWFQEHFQLENAMVPEEPLGTPYLRELGNPRLWSLVKKMVYFQTECPEVTGKGVHGNRPMEMWTMTFIRTGRQFETFRCTRCDKIDDDGGEVTGWEVFGLRRMIGDEPEDGRVLCKECRDFHMKPCNDCNIALGLYDQREHLAKHFQHQEIYHWIEPFELRCRKTKRAIKEVDN